MHMRSSFELWSEITVMKRRRGREEGRGRGRGGAKTPGVSAQLDESNHNCRICKVSRLNALCNCYVSKPSPAKSADVLTVLRINSSRSLPGQQVLT